MLEHGGNYCNGKNNFKPFATAANANVMSQADWEGLPALLSGFTSGKAASAEVNKAIGRPVLSRQRWRSTPPTKVGWMCLMMLI
jgi:hypothetical protein